MSSLSGVHLPIEVLQQIASSLDPLALIAVAQTCRTWRTLINPLPHDFVRRLLALELLPEHGGLVPRWDEIDSKVTPPFDSEEWNTTRYACCGCMKLQTHMMFDNHALLRRHVRKPPPGSIEHETSAVTDWEPLEPGIRLRRIHERASWIRQEGKALIKSIVDSHVPPAPFARESRAHQEEIARVVEQFLAGNARHKRRTFGEELLDGLKWVHSKQSIDFGEEDFPDLRRRVHRYRQFIYNEVDATTRGRALQSWFKMWVEDYDLYEAKYHWLKQQIAFSDHANRELIELDFDSGQSGSHTFKPLSIGRFRALDYFGDGSLYLLDTPGHTVGHISALARVTANPASFILFAGDVIHHAGELRPSKYCPLPESLIPDPFTPDPHPLDSHYGCPGAVFESLFAPRGRSPTEPFYAPPRLKNKEENFHDDVYELIRTLGKLQDADAHQNVLVAAAHDEALLDHVEFFPRGNMNEFLEKGWVRRVHWRFLRDFRKAVGKEDHDMMRREWGPERKGGNE
ncbi:hypothetical protein N0V88_007328 [Collariella sp. IMI 366227]|nr:hypothetical protein N0V88_007328 [Collariella sp. IMI 366227]